MERGEKRGKDGSPRPDFFAFLSRLRRMSARPLSSPGISPGALIHRRTPADRPAVDLPDRSATRP